MIQLLMDTFVPWRAGRESFGDPSCDRHDFVGIDNVVEEAEVVRFLSGCCL